jgi:site-specific DNA recombinase
MPQRKRAAGYLRVSQARDGMMADKIYRQEIESYAAAYSYRLVQVFGDLDYSGRKGSKARPGFTEMLRRCREFDLLIVPKLSRFGRSMRDNLAAYDQLEDAGVGLVFLDLRIDTTTSGGKLMRNVLTALAEYESDLISERWKDTHRYLARNGRHVGGGTVPFGYNYDPGTKELQVAPGEAPIVREVFRRFLEGSSISHMAHDLNERGIVSQRGKRQWSSTHVARMLDNPTYAGYRHHAGQLTEGQWRPLVDRETWEQVQGLRAATKAHTQADKRRGKGRNLLSGLLFCSCGAPMWRDSGSQPRRSAYKCALSAAKRRGACKAGQLSAGRAEALVGRLFLQRVSEPYAGRALKEPDSVLVGPEEAPAQLTADDRLQELDRRTERLIEMSLDSTGPASDQAIRARLEAIELERAELVAEQERAQSAGLLLRRRAEEVEQLRNRLADLPAIWEAATTEERNEMLRVAVDRIDSKGNGREKKLVITWAGWLGESRAAPPRSRPSSAT